MKVLIAYEASQEITKRLRSIGVEAYSNDLQECYGGFPDYHLQEDAEWVISSFRWDAIIMHYPCTYTALCGNRHYAGTKLRKDALEGLKRVWNLACSLCDKVALEQPKTTAQQVIGSKTQVIHPWQFGHGETKETWLWLKGFPNLVPTNEVEGREQRIFRKFGGNSKNRMNERSRTYPGIAQAIVEQWFVRPG